LIRSVQRLESGFASTGKRNGRVIMIPGAGHSFIDHSTHELMPAFTEALAAWVRTEVVEPGR
jgi:hypothetical protein